MVNLPLTRYTLSVAGLASIKKLFELERNFGLNGNLLLIHLGTDRRRHDKLYNRLNEIIIRLKKLGYRIEKLP